MYQQDSGSRTELVVALLGAEVAESGLDAAAMRAVYSGDHDVWVDAIEASGMFGFPALAEITASWAADPRVLRDALLAEADELTQRRCMSAWAALDVRPIAAAR
ncbi:hypothetical protein [Nocardia camponoti]|uniref:Uncharacterized protein n=1 Tax=Nocardia camponoti TaxID=1616106 RepID=A0A917VB38_9NOCA|nr:hypothetical protein [Nocardia camponoti]GGK56203.1 hypothetical protein GCM10011591_30270 [Nocardia camponoti]